MSVVRKYLIQKSIFGSLWTSLTVQPVSHSFFRRKFVGSSKLHRSKGMHVSVCRQKVSYSKVDFWKSNAMAPLTVHPVSLSFFRRKFVGIANYIEVKVCMSLSVVRKSLIRKSIFGSLMTWPRSFRLGWTFCSPCKHSTVSLPKRQQITKTT